MSGSDKKSKDIENATQRLKDAHHTAAMFMTTFMEQPDHVAVILATSKMDEILGHLIRLRLIPCSTGKDELLDSGQGLGTFSNRIDLSFRLGLIDDSLARALHIFRKIRNDFAHAYEGQALNQAPHKNRIEELENRAQSHSGVSKMEEIFSTSPLELPKEKKAFLIVSVLALTRLETAKLLIKKLDSNAAKVTPFP